MQINKSRKAVVVALYILYKVQARIRQKVLKIGTKEDKPRKLQPSKSALWCVLQGWIGKTTVKTKCWKSVANVLQNEC